MDGANETRRTHPVHVVHRVGAGLLGLGLWVFAALGFANGLPYFSTSGERVLGLSSNGLLSTISLVAGAVLIAAAVWKGPAASTATAAIGAAFVLSGLVHLAILNTSLNVLAFRMPNVLFSVIAGMLLLVLGSYGRFAGGLPPDSPYRSHRPAGEVPEPRPSDDVSSERDQELVDAELAMAEGHPTAEQEAMVRGEQRRLRARERARSQERARREQS